MYQDIIKRIRAGFSGFCVTTSEEARAESEIARAAEELGYTLSAWSVTSGLTCPDTNTGQDMPDPLDAVNALGEMQPKSILLLKDIQHFIGAFGQPPDPLLLRSLRDQIRNARSTAKAIVLLGCSIELPLDLQKEFTTIELDLPDRDTLRAMAEKLANSANIEADSKESTRS